MKFPQVIHVVIEGGSPPFFRLCEDGLEDLAIDPGQKVAIYQIEKIVTLKQRRWVE